MSTALNQDDSALKGKVSQALIESGGHLKMLSNLDEALGVSGPAESRSIADVSIELPATGAGVFPTDCLDGDELLQYVTVRILPGDRLQHLEACELCQSLVACAAPDEQQVQEMAGRLAHAGSYGMNQPASLPVDLLLREQQEDFRHLAAAGSQFEEVDLPKPSISGTGHIGQLAGSLRSFVEPFGWSAFGAGTALTFLWLAGSLSHVMQSAAPDKSFWAAESQSTSASKVELEFSNVNEELAIQIREASAASPDNADAAGKTFTVSASAEMLAPQHDAIFPKLRLSDLQMLDTSSVPAD